MQGKLCPRWSVAVVALLSALTIGLGGPHRAVVGDRAVGGVHLARYTLPDGSLPLLCLVDADQEQGDEVGSVFCIACLLAADLVVPPSGVASLDSPGPRAAAAPWPVRGPPAAVREVTAPSPPRAPPAV